LLAGLLLLLVRSTGFAAVVVASGEDPRLIQPPARVPRGGSLRWVAPHHAPDDGFHEQHYFVMSGDEHHFA
jgi:hypothetical protein